MADQKKLFMYLARRDKKGMKILNVFRGTSPATRVKDVKTLNLPFHLEKQLSKRVHKERMLWELWIESADTFAELREKLKKRGYKNLPTHSPGIYQPFMTTTEKEKEEVEITKKKRKMMLRKRDSNPGA